MTIKTTQKVITIGTSSGVTLPAKELRRAGIKPGDQIEVSFKRHVDNANDQEVMNTAKDLLKRYKDDYKNLANR
jgi:antitoxin component of MazEF toxin-antitoxin module